MQSQRHRIEPYSMTSILRVVVQLEVVRLTNTCPLALGVAIDNENGERTPFVF